MLVDTHCHIHEAGYPDAEGAYSRAIAGQVKTLICVGTDENTSADAVQFARTHENVFASIGVHPHESSKGFAGIKQILDEDSSRIVAIGEIGLDYFYTHSPRQAQIMAFEAQLQFARDTKLPVVFHVREAFDDFWPIYANFSNLPGVLHSYTDSQENLDKALTNGLFIGLNGISTFTKDEDQRRMYDHIPLERIVLETDAPFLTPAPHRGKVNEPAFVKHVAEYHAIRREIHLDQFARVTSTNASTLFSF
jgi:TatD DNase family protein